MRSRGFTLVELLVSLAMTAVVIGGLSVTVSLATDFAIKTPVRLAEFGDEIRLRQEFQTLLAGAYISQGEDDNNTFFIAENTDGVSTVPDTLTLTTLGSKVDGGFLRSTDKAFEDLNSQYGPQGGVSEVSLSTAAVGDSGEATGLFLRVQTPSDGDPAQGGFERLIVPSATDVTFEFWDGLGWTSTWDTRTNGRRIPAAVRLSYVDENDGNHTIVVRCVNSDVTQLNPLTLEGG